MPGLTANSRSVLGTSQSGWRSSAFSTGQRMTSSTGPSTAELPVADAIMTTADATGTALVANGIDKIYGLPGLHNDHLFDAMYKARDRLRVIHTRHEQTAGYMAMG